LKFTYRFDASEEISEDGWNAFEDLADDPGELAEEEWKAFEEGFKSEFVEPGENAFYCLCDCSEDRFDEAKAGREDPGNALANFYY
jgi:hypothetical protein